MPLVACPDCGHTVSDCAPSCPSCGGPMASQVIEATSKQWKSLQIGGALTAILATLVLIVTYDARHEVGITVGGVGLAISLILFVCGRIGAWWHHG